MIPARRWATWFLTTALLLAPMGAIPAGDAHAPYLGLSLRDALTRLQAGGLRIVYSSDLVRRDMRVETEPRSRWPQEVLNELLRPHGLESRPGPGGTVLVVQAPPRVAATERIVVRADDPAHRRELPAPVAFLDAEDRRARPRVSADPFRSLDRS